MSRNEFILALMWLSIVKTETCDIFKVSKNVKVTADLNVCEELEDKNA